MGQSDLALEQRQYYANESNTTIAYQQFIRELAGKLTNNSAMIETDVAAIFKFESDLAQVNRTLPWWCDSL